MAKGSFRFPLYGGGSTPDPAVYCPANGYVPDEPGAGNWELIAKFQTNSPGTTTFDPALATDPMTWDGKIAWKVDGVIYYTRDISITLDGTLKDAELYILKGSGLTVNSIVVDNDHIVGTLDLSFFKPHPTLASSISTYSNTLLTSIKFNQNKKFIVGNISAYSSNLTGTIDLSFIEKLSSSAIISFYSNPNLERIIFPSSIISGQLHLLYLNNCNLKGNIDLSAFNALSSTAGIRLNSNANLQSVTFPSSFTGAISQLYLHYCNFTSIDLSIIASQLTNYAAIQVSNNPNLSSVTFPTSATGKISQFNCSLTALTSIDLSAYDFTDTAAFYANNCASLTTINFKPGALGKFTQFNISYSNISSIDISQLPNCILKNSCNFSLNNNSMAAAMVDKILFDLAAIVASDATNYTGRQINIGGLGTTANAAPTDGTVTGYDGLTAKAYLISRSISVTSN